MIRRAAEADLPAAAALANELWPEADPRELTGELREGAVFLAYAHDVAQGFAHCSLRRDYVEGTSSSPVGYLEGIYVREPFRRHGLARELLAACEDWARRQGCREFAGDCELTNAASIAFHTGTGFREANRIVCFTKDL